MSENTMDDAIRFKLLDTMLISGKWLSAGIRFNLMVQLPGEKSIWTAVRSSEDPLELLAYYDLHEKIGWNALGAKYRIERVLFETLDWPQPIEVEG